MHLNAHSMPDMLSVKPSSLSKENLALSNPSAAADPKANAKIWESAQAFEATFITQMLTFSGLGDALTLGGGEHASPFASFYIESVSEQITQSGGFGLAEHIYSQLLDKSGQVDQEDQNVDFGTL